jgi:hypothetical protein
MVSKDDCRIQKFFRKRNEREIPIKYMNHILPNMK